MKICITGSSGLIGSSCTKFYLERNHSVIGIDNNSRKKFFGKFGSTHFQQQQLKQFKNYQHFAIDITNQNKIIEIFSTHKFDAIIHCAGQPSHDKAKNIPLLDFKTNAFGTLLLLEALRNYQPKAVFIFMSTNKVYGDSPNEIPLRELVHTYIFKNRKYGGVNEQFSIDQSTHSLFGVSKVAADLYTQEYGKYFGLKTTTLRLGCITGSHHAGVPLHGFLSYLVKSLIHTNSYKIVGYKGKQVRDQLHAEDVADATAKIIENPRKGVVYNLGGGFENSASILELIKIISKKCTINPDIIYEPKPRIGDHICYITDLSKFKRDYPTWKVSKNLLDIIDEMITYESSRYKNSRN